MLMLSSTSTQFENLHEGVVIGQNGPLPDRARKMLGMKSA